MSSEQRTGPLPGGGSHASVEETGGAAGRTVRAAAHLKRGDVVCVTESSSIAFSDEGDEERRYSCCALCGYPEDSSNRVVCSRDDGAAICRVCRAGGSDRHHMESIGECSMFDCMRADSLQADMPRGDAEEEDWLRDLPAHSLPAQLLLAFRVLVRHMHYHEDAEVTGNPFDLVGDASDCDEGRVAIARRLVAMGQSLRARHPLGERVAAALNEPAALRVLGILHRNAFKVRAGVIALFPGAAMFNHCCAPNAVMTVEYVSKTDEFQRPNDDETTAGIKNLPYRCLRATVRCLVDIAPGEEVSISYVPLALHPRAMRQGAVQERHSFLCGCAACSSGLGEGALLLQGVTSIGDMQLSTDPLSEMLEEAEELLQEDDCDMADVLFLLTQAEGAIENLQLGPLHYLCMKRLYLTVEAFHQKSDFSEVVKYSSEWLKRLSSDAGRSVERLCDPHYKCRMLVLHAEAHAKCLDNMRAMADVSGLTEGKKKEVLSALNKAIEYSSLIYGDDYALVESLRGYLPSVSGATLGAGVAEPGLITAAEEHNKEKDDLEEVEIGKTELPNDRKRPRIG